jgi:hypothetical protein
MSIFRPNKYNVPQPKVEICPAVSEGQTSDNNGTYVSDKDRQFVVKIYDGGKPSDLAVALGTLEIAADIIKNQMSRWHQADANRSGIIVPGPQEQVSVH